MTKNKDGKIKYHDDFCEKAFMMSLHGKTSVFMAKKFSVNPSTVSMWRYQYPHFDQAISLGKKARMLKIVSIVESLISEHDGEVIE
ncbi:MAG: hypothetical protein IPO40_24940 [Fibrobacteres bacterium]|nr:hypothetical protein [Fibrobacterota bacterium]